MSRNEHRSPATVVIGYRTRPVEGLHRLLPEFKAPADYRDAGRIAEHVANQRAEFLAAAKDMPYTGTFDEVVLVDPRNDTSLLWKYPAADEGKAPVAVRVKNYLLRHYPDAWSNEVARKPPQVVLVGFEIRTFLKILGIECALPGVAEPCPLNLWYGNGDHRDVGDLVMPRDTCKGMTLPYVLTFWRPRERDEGAEWDALLSGWTGPGVFPERDARIAVGVAHRVGFDFDG